MQKNPGGRQWKRVMAVGLAFLISQMQVVSSKLRLGETALGF